MSDESSDSEEELQAKGDIKGVDQVRILIKYFFGKSRAYFRLNVYLFRTKL